MFYVIYILHKTPMSTLSNSSIKRLIDFFRKEGDKILSYKELDILISDNREKLKIRNNLSFKSLVKQLVDKNILNIAEFNFPSRKERRYSFKDHNIYTWTQSLYNKAYFSHYSALFLNQLTEQIPKTVYINREQNNESFSTQELTQDAINRAFANRQRNSNTRAEINGYEVVLINGKKTNNLGTTQQYYENSLITFTDKERTLIDIIVRPDYSGGIHEIIKAFQIASQDISINKLNSYYKNLKYIYPYHQALGFLLEMTGKFSKDKLQIFKEHGLRFDFYLGYKLKEPSYNAKWKLFFPKEVEPYLIQS